MSAALPTETPRHAPGPWRVGPVDDTVVTRLGDDGIRYEIAAVDGDYNQPDQWPVMEANARLIAAAPDMLAALKDAHAMLATVEVIDGEDGDPWSKALARMSNVIAKAQGGAS